MNHYCLLDENKDVVFGPAPLLRSWGQTSNLDAMNDEELRGIGWFPAEVLYDPLPTQFHYLGPPVAELQGDHVRVHYQATLPPRGQIVEQQKQRVNEVRDAKRLEGVAWNGHRFAADVISCANITGMVVGTGAGVPLPPDFTWRSNANVDVPLTAAQLTQLASAMLVYVNAVYKRAWALKAQIDAAGNPEALDIEAIW